MQAFHEIVMAKQEIPIGNRVDHEGRNENDHSRIATYLLTLPAIASRARSGYSAVRPVSLRAHGKSFRKSPLHCSGRSDPSRQEHVGPHPGRTSQRATANGA